MKFLTCVAGFEDGGRRAGAREYDWPLEAEVTTSKKIRNLSPRTRGNNLSEPGNRFFPRTSWQKPILLTFYYSLNSEKPANPF